MISIEQLNGEIAILEDETPTHVVMQKLASLYTVRDHMMTIPNVVSSPASPSVVPPFGSTEFAEKVEGKDLIKTLSLVDEIITTISVLNPSLYAKIMREL